METLVENNWLWGENYYVCKKVDSTTASSTTAVVAKKNSNERVNLNGGTIPSLVRAIVQEVMSKKLQGYWANVVGAPRFSVLRF